MAASFFFSRGKDRRGAAKYLFATLAYQICIVIPELQDEIRQALNNDPTILDQSLEIQIQKLLVKPYHSIMHSGTPNVLLSQHPFLIIIDGLDECHGDQMHCTILAYITALVATHGLPFFFLIASRPEPHIRHEFNCNMVLSNISITSPLDCSDTDIRVFLENGFHIIRAQYRAHTLSTISETWPSPEDIDALVQRSSGYFIYPATVLKFIDQPDTRPQAQLRLVLSNNLTSFTELDQLYHQIMSTVPDTQSLLLILGPIVVDTDNYFRPSQRSNVVLAHLLSLDEGDIRLTLRRMHPLLTIPDNPYDPIQIIHASFSEFLLSRERAGRFHINSSLVYAGVARGCLAYMKGWHTIRLGVATGLAEFEKYVACHWATSCCQVVDPHHLVQILSDLREIDSFSCPQDLSRSSLWFSVANQLSEGLKWLQVSYTSWSEPGYRSVYLVRSQGLPAPPLEVVQRVNNAYTAPRNPADDMVMSGLRILPVFC